MRKTTLLLAFAGILLLASPLLAATSLYNDTGTVTTHVPSGSAGADISGGSGDRLTVTISSATTTTTSSGGGGGGGGTTTTEAEGEEEGEAEEAAPGEEAPAEEEGVVVTPEDIQEDIEDAEDEIAGLLADIEVLKGVGADTTAIEDYVAQAQAKIDEAKKAWAEGDYKRAKALMEEANQLLTKAKERTEIKQEEYGIKKPISKYVWVVLLMVLLGGGYWYYQKLTVPQTGKKK